MAGKQGASLLLLAATLALGGCAHTPPDDPADPLEKVNRAVFTFNEKADRYVLRPAAKAYEWTLPSVVRTGIGNFFTNLFTPTIILNDLLQLKFMAAGRDLGRFVINSTIGLGGLVDVATTEGMDVPDEDFGQTLGHWGIGPGGYLMLPFLGPSSNRDLLGAGGDYFTNPLIYLDNGDVALALGALDTVDTRAQLLSFDSVLQQQLDRYVFVRTVYLQNRLNKVYDGNPPKEDFGFEE